MLNYIKKWLQARRLHNFKKQFFLRKIDGLWYISRRVQQGANLPTTKYIDIGTQGSFYEWRDQNNIDSLRFTDKQVSEGVHVPVLKEVLEYFISVEGTLVSTLDGTILSGTQVKVDFEK